MYDQPVKIGEGGRIVLPAEFRKTLGLDIGDELVLHMEGGRLMLLTRDQAVQFVQERMAAYTPKGRLLSEELIQERQKEADHD